MESSLSFPFFSNISVVTFEKDFSMSVSGPLKSILLGFIFCSSSSSKFIITLSLSFIFRRTFFIFSMSSSSSPLLSTIGSIPDKSGLIGSSLIGISCFI